MLEKLECSWLLLLKGYLYMLMVYFILGLLVINVFKPLGILYLGISLGLMLKSGLLLLENIVLKN